jgi:hypothetical protein
MSRVEERCGGICKGFSILNKSFSQLSCSYAKELQREYSKKEGNYQTMGLLAEATQTRLSARVQSPAACGGLGSVKVSRHNRATINIDALPRNTSAAILCEKYRDSGNFFWLYEALLRTRFLQCRTRLCGRDASARHDILYAVVSHGSIDVAGADCVDRNIVWC